MHTPAPTRRDAWVDLAKGLGIALVVYGHVARGLVKAGIWAESPLFHFLDAALYSFHMPLFFLLSGLYFQSSFDRHGARLLLAEKWDRIVYPYLLWSLVQGGIELLLSGYTNGHVSGLALIQMLWHPRAQFWFLYVLFLLFVALIALRTLTGARPWLWLILGALTWPWAMYGNLPFPLDYLAYYALYFTLGCTFPSWPGQLRTLPRPLWLGALALFILLLLHIHPVLETAQPAPAWVQFLLSLSGCCIVVGLAQGLATLPRSVPIDIVQTVLTHLGRYSMPIFLMHILASSGVRILLNKGLGLHAPYAHALLGWSAGLLLPWLLARQLARAPESAAQALLRPPSRLSLHRLLGRH